MCIHVYQIACVVMHHKCVLSSDTVCSAVRGHLFQGDPKVRHLIQQKQSHVQQNIESQAQQGIGARIAN